MGPADRCDAGLRRRGRLPAGRPREHLRRNPVSWRPRSRSSADRHRGTARLGQARGGAAATGPSRARAPLVSHVRGAGICRHRVGSDPRARSPPTPRTRAPGQSARADVVRLAPPLIRTRSRPTRSCALPDSGRCRVRHSSGHDLTAAEQAAGSTRRREKPTWARRRWPAESSRCCSQAELRTRLIRRRIDDLAEPDGLASGGTHLGRGESLGRGRVSRYASAMWVAPRDERSRSWRRRDGAGGQRAETVPPVNSARRTLRSCSGSAARPAEAGLLATPQQHVPRLTVRRVAGMHVRVAGGGHAPSTDRGPRDGAGAAVGRSVTV